jgi:hypothetical protein
MFGSIPSARLAGFAPGRMGFESPLGIGGFLFTLTRGGLGAAMMAGNLLSSRTMK